MDGNEELQLQMWKQSVDSMYYYLRSVSAEGSVFLAEALEGKKYLKSGELVCFMPAICCLVLAICKYPPMRHLLKS